MLVHKPLGALFYLEPHTASRRCREILEKRGFEEIFGHHDGLCSTNNVNQHGEPELGLGDLYAYNTIGVVVRDHFDVLLSQWVKHLRVHKPTRFYSLESIEDMRVPPYFVEMKSPDISLHRGKMFPLAWEALAISEFCAVDPLILHYESLRTWMNIFLDFVGLPNAELDEWPNTHSTPNKPRTNGKPWKFFTDTAKEKVINAYRFERDLLGYPNDV